MDVRAVLRVARQTAGLSQRDVAALSGVPQSTLANAENGRRGLGGAALDRVLEACGLDLELVARGSGQVDSDELAALVEHLRLSTTQRLLLAVGGSGRWSDQPFDETLVSLNRTRGQALVPEVARGVWIPGRVWDGTGPLTEPADRERQHVGIRVGAWTWVHVDPPLALALRSTGDDRRLLLAAASLLAMTDDRDEGGRRPPPHRTPDESNERAHLARSLTYAMYRVDPLPDSRESRGWRLDQPVSLRQQLILMGWPPRRGSKRR